MVSLSGENAFSLDFLFLTYFFLRYCDLGRIYNMEAGIRKISIEMLRLAVPSLLGDRSFFRKELEE